MSRLLDPENFVADKLAWHQRIVTDPTLSVGAKAVAGLLLHDLNSAAGGAWRGQGSMAANLGQSDRQLRRHLADLQEAGYLEIDVRKGRSRTNMYRAMVPEVVAEVAEKRTPTTAQTVQNRTPASGQTPKNRTSAAGKPDMGVRQFLYDPIRKFPAPAPRSTGPSMRPRFPCADLRRLVVSLGGEGAAVSYLDQAGWDPVDNRILCASDTAVTRLTELAGRLLRERGVSLARRAAEPSQHRMAA
ncbi:helix-turn-helix domain-containing protein [Brevundimonas sp. FT23028]|uniref:helix-turn-helix domain-containing protein n=1 Tax=Brevundimonas sp. FT23028 TaxID=3393748 RepID=UPI003B58A695